MGHRRQQPPARVVDLGRRWQPQRAAAHPTRRCHHRRRSLVPASPTRSPLQRWRVEAAHPTAAAASAPRRQTPTRGGCSSGSGPPASWSRRRPAPRGGWCPRPRLRRRQEPRPAARALGGRELADEAAVDAQQRHRRRVGAEQPHQSGPQWHARAHGHAHHRLVGGGGDAGVDGGVAASPARATHHGGRCGDRVLREHPKRSPPHQPRDDRRLGEEVHHVAAVGVDERHPVGAPARRGLDRLRQRRGRVEADELVAPRRDGHRPRLAREHRGQRVAAAAAAAPMPSAALPPKVSAAITDDATSMSSRMAV
ncbi:hypothetical protein I4F81_005813 [Pyropia yezoensis]|uniref:Uncharacterized protein n=1 Tax=Pyropia yezoensis TaxID=2788 RepID=A0ACC3BZS6_PYRYE|nr:hypothetical protein I4F81_005813 [Neopyropia yezoensis]